ncbi:helix-turn-helix domain-containing protein [Pseudonocardia halophobica]|uniref:helix-turn-helix domain-containing protein n=1 Tax=Pseudonocardia halophobica TaxID=29401 RepID=UPI003D928EDA
MSATEPVPVADLYETLASWLHTLGELGSEVDRFTELADFLDHVAATAVTMLGYDHAMVLTMDDRGSMRAAGSHALSPDYVRNVWIPPPRAGTHPWTPVREAYRTGAPSVVADVEREPRLHYFHAVFRREGVRSYGCFPLRSRDGCLGVLTVYLRRVHEFTPLETTVMSALAGFAASAVRAATLRQERDARFAEQQALLRYRERAADIHDTLMGVVLARRGLSGVVDALARLLEGTVVIGDPAGRVLAVGDRLDRPAAVRDLVRAVSATGAGAAPPAGVQHAPVAVEGTEVGRVWADVPQHLDPTLVRQALEHGAVAVAVHMLGERVQLQSRQRADAALLGELVAVRPGSAVDEVLDRADRLGYRLRGRLEVLVVGTAGRLEPEEQAALVPALRSRVDELVTGALVAAHQGRIAALVPETAERVEDGPALVAQELAKTAVRSALDGVRVVVAGACTDLVELDELLEFGDRIAALAGRDRRTGPTVVDGRRFGIYRILLASASPDRLSRLRDEFLGPLLAYDAEHRTDLVATVECFLRHGMRTKDTARELVVHVNSLAYRLRRAEEILGFDVRGAETLAQLQFALQLDALLRSGPD